MKYVLRPNVKLIDIQGDLALFLSFGNRVILKSPAIHRGLFVVAEQLKKPCDKDVFQNVLFSNSKDAHEAKLVDALIAELIKKGLVETVEDESVPMDQLDDWAVFFSRFSHSTQKAAQLRQILKEKSVDLVCLDGMGLALENALKKQGVERLQRYDKAIALYDQYDPTFDSAAPSLFRPDRCEADLVIVSAYWSDQNRLLGLNREFFDRGIRWCVLFQDYFGGTLSPVFGIDGELCFQCFYDRRLSNILSVDKYELLLSTPTSVEERTLYPEIFTELLGLNVALEIGKYLSDYMPTQILKGCIEFDFLNGRRGTHDILPIPVCSVCSEYDFRGSVMAHQKSL